MLPRLPIALVLAFAAGCGCRVGPDSVDPQGDPGPVPTPQVLAPTPVGSTASVWISLADWPDPLAELDIQADLPGLSAETLAQPRVLHVSFSPESEGLDGTLVVGLAAGDLEVQVSSVAAPSVHPAPLAVHIGHEAMDSMDGTGLGQMVVPETGLVPFAADPITGNAFFGDPAQGRAWRQDVFYRHPTWGTWVNDDRSLKAPWDTPPDCFEEPTGLTQDGTCTGEERDSGGSIPKAWRYFHGGFAGDGELGGLVSLVADPDRGRVWASVPGTIHAIDTDLETTPDEDTPYSFTQVVPGARIDLGPEWAEPWLGWVAGALLVVDRADGDLGLLDPDSGSLTATESLDIGALSGVVSDGEILWLQSGQNTIGVGSEGELRGTQGVPADWLDGPPSDAAAGMERSWFAMGPGLLVTGAEHHSLSIPPWGGQVTGVALDQVSGGAAEPLDIVYVAGHTDGHGWLATAWPDGAWTGERIDLPAPPRSLHHARAPHDLYILYAPGAEGCDGEDADFANLCTDGQHPAVVQSMYNPYGLVPPTSTDRPLQLFLSPIVETPKDNSIDIDFTNGAGCQEVDPDDPRALGCCALDWVVQERLAPNQAYFEDQLQTVGAETAATEDDPTLAWGINPSFLRQAWLCLASEDPGHRAAGQAAYEAIDGLWGPRSELTAWTHTAASGAGGATNANHLFYMGLLYEDGVDFALPLDTQAEYEMLHEGLAAVFAPDGLGDGGLDGIDLWTPLGSGNALDVPDLLDPVTGWAEDDPSWVRPIRDGPLAIGDPARSGYYFLSMGGQSAFGPDTYRKKELWHLDVRDRAHIHALSEDIDGPWPGSGDSALLNIPGMSWELGTLVRIAKAGTFRETLKYGQTINAANWENQFRYLRRILATAEPDAPKAFYQHIFDVTHPNGLLTENSSVGVDNDVNRTALERINTELVGPGYARWATPTEIIHGAQ